MTIDHLAFTVKGSTSKEVQHLLGGDWVMRKGWRGYANSWERREGEAVTLMGANMPGYPGQVHVQLAGAASKSMPLGAMQSLMHWVKKVKQGHVTRVDIAMDDFSGLLKVDQVEQAIEAGKMVTRSNVWSVQKSGSLKTGKVGKSIYIGSPESKTRHVIYDKAAEQEAKGKSYEGSWVRVESRYQDERADVLMGVLCNCSQEIIGSVAMSYLVGSLDFREITRGMASWDKSRSEKLPWWEQFVESVQGLRLSVEKVEQTIEKVAEWVSKSLSPMLAVVVGNKSLGWVWLEQEIARGKASWNDRHRGLVGLEA
jgi:DNA relaxase NicK